MTGRGGTCRKFHSSDGFRKALKKIVAEAVIEPHPRLHPGSAFSVTCCTPGEPQNGAYHPQPRSSRWLSTPAGWPWDWADPGEFCRSGSPGCPQGRPVHQGAHLGSPPPTPRLTSPRTYGGFLDHLHTGHLHSESRLGVGDLRQSSCKRSNAVLFPHPTGCDLGFPPCKFHKWLGSHPYH